MKKELYATVNHLEDYGGTSCFRIGQEVILKRDRNNPYDDEAISVHDTNRIKCGYVANSVCTVARGTCSAGRLCEKISEEQKAVIEFILDDAMIVRLQEGSAD